MRIPANSPMRIAMLQRYPTTNPNIAAEVRTLRRAIQQFKSKPNITKTNSQERFADLIRSTLWIPAVGYRMLRLDSIPIAKKLLLLKHCLQNNLAPAEAHYLYGTACRSGDFLNHHESGILLRLIREIGSSNQTDIIDNKQRFFEFFTQAQIDFPLPRLFARITNNCDPSLFHEPPSKYGEVFIKNSHQSGGKGSSLWIRTESTRWANHSSLVTWNELIQNLKTNLLPDTEQLIYERLRNHSELVDLSSTSLNTLRITTTTNPQSAQCNPIAIPLSVYRMGINNNIVDNASSGGILSAVTEDGNLCTAISLSHSRHHEFHPTTGARIAGRQIPFYKDAVHLAKRAHTQLPDVYTVGWDIAITDNGPVLIEGNTLWDSSVQLAHGRGLNDTPFITTALYAIANWSPTSRVSRGSSNVAD